jgi:outer membrane protein assembly factor BamB
LAFGPGLAYSSGVTLDADVRAKERVAKTRPDDGAAQVGLATALARVGREREALEAFIRAAGSEPADPEVVRALSDVAWWGGPRGPSGGSRALAVPSMRRPGDLVFARRLGGKGMGLALGRGIVLARIQEDERDWRLVAAALATGRELWSHDDAAVAAAPPLVSDDLVIDAVLVTASRGLILRVRARDAATGRERWRLDEALPELPQRGAIFAAADLAGRRVALGVGNHGKVDFQQLLRVVDVASGNPVEKSSVRGLNELALDADRVYVSAAHDPNRRIEARRLPDGGRVWDAVREERTTRVAVSGELVVCATESRLLTLARASGAVRWSLNYRLAGSDALVVTPRAVIGVFGREGTIAFDLETGDRIFSDGMPARLLAATEDTLYGVVETGLKVRALDLLTGERIFEQDLAALRHPELQGSTGIHKLAVAPSRLVALTREGVLFVVAVPPGAEEPG